MHAFGYFVVIVAVLICLIGFKIRQVDTTLGRDIKIYSELATIENHLDEFKDLIGSDFPGYRGHIYRVLTYAMHYLENDTKYLDEIAVGLVYHDIGLWTAKTLSYVDPSCNLARSKLSKEFSAESLQIIHDVIYWHHKVNTFHGAHESVVDAVRKAYWIDATKGILNQGMPTTHILQFESTIANNGFHQTLADFGPRLHGWDILGIVRNISQIYRW